MNTVAKIYDFIDSIAPFNTALPFDNCGILVGDKENQVSSCVIALDMTVSVLNFAKQNNASLIITHHPVIFDPIKSVIADDIVYQLIQSNIAVICAHTNLDLAADGVNDTLANRLLLTDIVSFENEYNIGRVGKLPRAMSCNELACLIKEKLFAKVVTFTDCDREIKTVAVLGGEGSDFLYASKKYDAYITGEVKHHIYSYAQNAGIQIFVAGHYETEAVVLTPLKAMLENEFRDIKFLVYDSSDIKSV
ncbi:MAG: Nif3-like dinuclear metal center hexameric protein [Oscillospiraceae bacterium]